MKRGHSYFWCESIMPLALDFKPVKTLLGIFQWFGRSEEQDDLKDKINEVIFKIKMLEDRIAETRIRIERRVEELFRKATAALRTGNRERAEIYAYEIAHLRNILKLIRAIEHMLIQTVERLKTTSDVKELTEILLTFGAAIDEVSSQIRNVYPALAIAFNEVSKSIKLLLIETSPPNLTDFDVSSISSEANKIIEEALRAAEADVNKLLPDETVREVLEKSGVKLEQKQRPTHQSIAPRSAQQTPVGARAQRGERIAGGTTATRVAAVPQPSLSARKPRKLTEEELEKKVLEYIKEHGGFLDLNDFCSKYGVTREEVLKALYRLHSKGLIRIS